MIKGPPMLASIALRGRLDNGGRGHTGGGDVVCLECMKTKLSLYAVIGACALCFGMPLSGRADDRVTKTKKAKQSEKQDLARQKQERTKASQTYQGEQRTRIVKRGTVTGSYIPQTYEKNGPSVNTRQPVSVYDRRDLEKNGYYSIGSSLKRVDPSITVSGTP